MLNDFNCNCPVYMACGYTDLHKGIDGLTTIVEHNTISPLVQMRSSFSVAEEQIE